MVIDKNKSRLYCEKHDSYFDPVNGWWLEKSCCKNGKHSFCSFCEDRPERHAPHPWKMPDGKRVCR